MKKINLVIFLIVLVMISCSEKNILFDERIVYIEYISDEYTNHIPTANIEVLIKNNSMDTLEWNKKILIEGNGETNVYESDQEVILYPQELIVKQIKVVLNDKQLELLKQRCHLGVTVIDNNDSSKYDLLLDEDYNCCQKRIENSACKGQRPDKLFLLRRI